MAIAAQQGKDSPGLLARYMPILHWLPRYHKEWLMGDIVAGLSVWALMVPQCLGFAAICGVPVQYGLYAAAIALIVYAIFASSHHVVSGLMDVKAMKRIYRLNRSEFWVGTIALLGVLTFGTLQGVLIGLLLSLLVLIARSAKPNIPVLGRAPGTDVFHSLDQYPDSETYPGLVIIRFDGPLYFATANALRDKVRAVTTDTHPPVAMVLIDMESVNYLDLEGSDMLKEIAENTKGIGVEVHLARVKHELMDILVKDEVDQIIGHDHIHSKVAEAVSWFNRKTQTAVQNHE